MKLKRKAISSILAWLVIITVAILFFKALVTNWNNLGDVQLRPDAWILVALVCFVLSVVASGIVWGRVINRLSGLDIPVNEAVRIHLASWLLKYIPGQAGSLINKINWGKKRLIDGKKITASFIYENAFLILASTLTTIPILVLSLSDRFADDPVLFIPAAISIVLALLTMQPKIFKLLLNKLFKLFKKQQLEESDLFSLKTNFVFFIEFIIPRILNGAAFVLLSISLVGLDPSLFLVFGAIYVLAGIIGVLAIFVPSGLGVREAVITLFASAYMPVEQAVTLALVARFYATIADLLVALLLGSLNLRRREIR